MACFKIKVKEAERREVVRCKAQVEKRTKEYFVRFHFISGFLV